MTQPDPPRPDPLRNEPQIKRHELPQTSAANTACPNDGGRGERLAPDGTFLKSGYNSELDPLPLDVEPLARSRSGNAVDVRRLDGSVAINDDDDAVLGQDEGLD
ncbi:MAG: hypothetical protein ACTHLA_03160 [Asticcacaulis sp.]|uniref:hypothetical protein n=1 Tax=Asticcacaulis sp. TaxID=1872648 RepID=UPI003F7C2BB7